MTDEADEEEGKREVKKRRVRLEWVSLTETKWRIERIAQDLGIQIDADGTVSELEAEMIRATMRKRRIRGAPPSGKIPGAHSIQGGRPESKRRK
jgi:hypothetical protein